MDGTGRVPGRLVCCGLTTLDVVQTVDHVPGPDEKVVARDLWVSSGGPAANAAVTAVALGVEVVLVTRVGGGPLGRVAADDLVAHGVELVDLAGPEASPAVSTVLVTASTGERAVVSVNDRGGVVSGGAGSSRGAGASAGGEGSSAGAGASSGAESSSSGGAGSSSGAEGSSSGGAGSSAGAEGSSSGPSWDVALAGVDAVLVDGHHLDLAVPLAAAARRLGIPVLLDGGSWKPGLEKLLAHTDVALLSADFRLPGGGPVPSGTAAETRDGGFAGLGTAGQGGTGQGVAGLLGATSALGPSVVARSQGAGPLQLLDRRGAATSAEITEIAEIAVPRVDVQDTLGAGDVLHGALAAWLAATTASAPLSPDTPAPQADLGAPRPVVTGAARTGTTPTASVITGTTAALLSGLGFAASVASTSCTAAGARGWLAQPQLVASARESMRRTLARA